MRTPHRILAPLVLLALCAGCTSSSSSSSSSVNPRKGRSPDYNVIRLYNESPDDILDIELSAGGTVTALDHLPAEHSPVSDRGVSPDPATATVSWRTRDGRRFERQVAVASQLPPKFRGVIVLRLMEAGDVNVTFVSYDELR